MNHVTAPPMSTAINVATGVSQSVPPRSMTTVGSIDPRLRRDPDKHEHLFVYAQPMSDHDLPQRVVLGALLEAHPRLLETNELTARLPEVPRLNQVVRVLVDDGLATRMGDLVGATRAAGLAYRTLHQARHIVAIRGLIRGSTGAHLDGILESARSPSRQATT